MPVRKSIHDYSRQSMIERLERRGIADPCVLAAVASVPREWFVPPAHAVDAHADRELSIGFGETIEPPTASIRAIDALVLDPDDKVLEIGTGTGYTAAVLSQLVPHVDSVERIPYLAEAARERLARLAYEGIEIHVGDGSLGWPPHAPYDAIVVWGAARTVPPLLLEQLAPRGRLVMPIGPVNEQQLVLFTKETAGACVARWLGPVVFTPLVT
jgi:protein-L-isoaspartate(D-aspartate) O-methyltransferase